MGVEPAAVAARQRWRRVAARLLSAGAVLLFLLAMVSFFAWRSEMAELRRIVAPHIDADAEPRDIAFQALEFMEDHVGYERAPGHFLLPVFGFMRPTALQVIREGGDCAYRSRAYIVILGLYGIEAQKRALYDARGVPVHAVVEVEFDEGPPYVMDLLFNVAHERADGTPLTLSELADEDVLEASLARAVAGGNERARRYPLRDYGFDDVRTINWDKSPVMAAAYRVLSGTLGDARARAMPRPYLAEEPALMVIVLAMSGVAGLLLLVLIVRPRAGRSSPMAGRPASMPDPAPAPTPQVASMHE